MSKRSPQRYHHGDLRSALIAASVDLVREHGADNFALKDASTIAGVSVAAPYRHFSDKVELLLAVASEGFTMMRADMLDATADMTFGSLECIATLGVTYIEFSQKQPHLFQLMFSDLTTGPMVNLDQDQTAEANLNLNDLLSVMDAVQHDRDHWADQLPTESAKCFSILLVNIATFLKNNDIPITETLEVAAPLWASVHGTAGLMLDHSFQNLRPAIDPKQMIRDTTHYICNGYLNAYRQ